MDNDWTLKPTGNIISLTEANDISFTKIAHFSLLTRAILPSGLRVPEAKVGYGWVVTSPGTLTHMSLSEWEYHRNEKLNN